jgi:hypothetical protein
VTGISQAIAGVIRWAHIRFIDEYLARPRTATQTFKLTPQSSALHLGAIARANGI